MSLRGERRRPDSNRPGDPPTKSIAGKLTILGVEPSPGWRGFPTISSRKRGTIIRALVGKLSFRLDRLFLGLSSVPIQSSS